MDLSHLGHPGAHHRPAHLKAKDKVAEAVPPFDWSQVTEDTIGNVPNLFNIPDKDQGSGGSCTCQATGYGFFKCTGIDISRHDLYSHVFLPGGGAYLNAPLDWLKGHGFVLLSKYPDPSPQSEANMEQTFVVADGDRIRTFQLSYTFYADVSNIDSAAHAVNQHDYIHLGIDGDWTDGWQNPVDPAPPKNLSESGVWGHALFACKDSICLRNGIPTIKAKSSWCNSKIYCHYLNKNYFPAVFEIIGVDIKELNMKFIEDKGTVFLVSTDGKTKVGIGNEDVITQFFPTEPITPGDTSGIPSIGTLADGVILHK